MGDPFQLWELRNPDGGPTGLEWARAKIGIVDRVLLHAAPERVDVQIHDEAGWLDNSARICAAIASARVRSDSGLADNIATTGTAFDALRSEYARRVASSAPNTSRPGRKALARGCFLNASM